MSKIRVAKPTRTLFETEIKLRCSDINYGGHLGNDSVLTLAQHARILFLESHGWLELDCCGNSLIMTGAAVMYRSQAYLGDIITVSLDVQNAKHSSFDFIYLFTNKETGKEIARVQSSMAFFDYTKKSLASIPEQFNQAII